MKGYVKALGLLFLAVFVLAGFAQAAVEGKGSEKPLTFIQFSALPENRGLHGRWLQHRYEDYRKGRFIPKTTLEVSEMR